LVSEFIEHLQIVTTSNCSTNANSHSAIHYRTHLILLSLLCVHQLSRNGFQQCPLFPCSRSYRLATVLQLSNLNSTRLHSRNSTRSVEWYSLRADPTENTVPLLMWVALYHVFHYSGIVGPLPDRVATPLPSALLLLRDVTADVDMTCSSVACAIIVTLIGCLLCRNLATALHMQHYFAYI
jgi:hypothetical protein